ncbi:bifunctional phosphopantothenoylcysteine decarboxylase/phosphopantothenate--cysteine ligase CoaBC [Virgibacillus sediminis]|uniref:Coenzyme A biosynthesis bifunctional protein CoaBC n=1 Tax=Virgibacillus sediminis TaxID=202260 RepID=A0ABV7AAK0_9BACI
MIEGKNILLGVSGGIAAYKACSLASKLTQKGASVKVMMTESAQEFVAPLTFQALSRNPVYIDTFVERDPEKIAHIDAADWADIILLAPATANIIGKIAGGIADDMLSTTVLASKADVYIAPAMNVNMYAHPAVMRNMKLLEEWGYHFIEPGAGYLACGWIGKGRLEEPEEIIQTIELHQSRNLLLSGRKVLISAGPTREKVDPVRFFTNRSSGRMGFALAEEAGKMGADVTLVAGPTELELSNSAINRVDVTTAEEMYHAMHEHFLQSDIVIKAAAVADYRPKHVYDEKMKKQDGNLTMEMERTKDILKSLGEEKTGQYLVGFAAETSNPLENGWKKLKTKNLDAVVINNVSAEGAGFHGETNIVTFVNKHHEQQEIPLANKQVIAEEILKLIERNLKDEEE